MIALVLALLGCTPKEELPDLDPPEVLEIPSLDGVDLEALFVEALQLSLAQRCCVCVALAFDSKMTALSSCGSRVAAMLKSDPVTATIPIIMVSAHDGRAARLIGLESGAEDYLAKPVDPAELLAKIRNLLLLQQRTLHAAQH